MNNKIQMISDVDILDICMHSGSISRMSAYVTQNPVYCLTGSGELVRIKTNCEALLKIVDYYLETPKKEINSSEFLLALDGKSQNVNLNKLANVMYINTKQGIESLLKENKGEDEITSSVLIYLSTAFGEFYSKI